MESQLKLKIYGSAEYKGLTRCGRTIFKSVVEDLDERGILKFNDIPTIALYAKNINIAKLAWKDIEKYGTVIKQTDNYHGDIMKANPAVNVFNLANASVIKLANQLGLTPGGRKRMKGEEIIKSAADEWEEAND